jgi:hypothetical protein
MTKGEESFVNEYTRQLLVGWCNHQVQSGGSGLLPLIDPRSVYAAHAIEKGWLAKDGSRVLAKGFEVAAAYLRR